MVVLKTSKLFSGMVASELEVLEHTAQVKAYKAGRNIFQEGDPGDGLYLILEGKVQITCLLGQDQRTVLSQLDAGDFFGEMAVLDNQPRSATATAETDTKVYFILRDDLLKVLERSPSLAANLVREFSLRMRDFNHQYTREVLQAERLTLVGRFARSIVHDLKNPLNIIGISAEMAAMDNATRNDRRAAKDRIRKQIDRLSDMINELLEFTRGSSATVVLAKSSYADFIRQLLKEIRPRERASIYAGAHLVYRHEPHPPAAGTGRQPDCRRRSGRAPGERRERTRRKRARRPGHPRHCGNPGRRPQSDPRHRRRLRHEQGRRVALSGTPRDQQDPAGGRPRRHHDDGLSRRSAA